LKTSKAVVCDFIIYFKWESYLIVIPK